MAICRQFTVGSSPVVGGFSAPEVAPRSHVTSLRAASGSCAREPSGRVRVADRAKARGLAGRRLPWRNGGGRADNDRVVGLAGIRDVIGEEVEGQREIPDESDQDQLTAPWHTREGRTSLPHPAITGEQRGTQRRIVERTDRDVVKRRLPAHEERGSWCSCWLRSIRVIRGAAGRA